MDDASPNRPDWRAELRARFSDTDADPDIIDELAHHLADQYTELRSRGASDADARALLRAQLADSAVDERMLIRRRRPPDDAIGGEPTAGTALGSVWRDLRYGLRSLRRSPAFTIVAVLSLALGIGANTAIFGVMYTVLFQRLALRHPEQLVEVRRVAGAATADRFAYAEYLALRGAPAAPRLEAISVTPVTIATRNDQDFAALDLVTGGYFDLLGVRPLLGRTITAADVGARAQVVVLSQEIWERFFAGHPAAIGQTVTLHGAPFTVVGVLPRAFRGLMFSGTFAAAAPISVASMLGAADIQRSDRPLLLSLVARLEAGSTPERATRRLDQIFQACCVAVPLPGAPKMGAVAGVRQHLVAVDASRGVANQKQDLRGEYRRTLFALMAGVALVLLIACANVGNLLLARGTGRRRELAIRMSMGATRARMIRQLLAESIELAVLGGVVGFGVARLGIGLLAHYLPPISGPVAATIAGPPSPAIFVFTAAATIACTVLFGVFPAFRATRVDIVTPLKDGGRGARRAKRVGVDRGIVVAQVALALVLLCTATLFVATLRNLEGHDGGYGSTRVLLTTVETRGTSYEPQGMAPFYQDILMRVRATPGVKTAAMASILPVAGGRWSYGPIRIAGYTPAPGEEMNAQFAAVTSDYFAATGIGMVAGREFDDRDASGSEKVAIVSDAFARHYLVHRTPIGASIVIGDGADAVSMRVVGVARDARYGDLRSPPTELYYVPVAQSGNWPFLELAVRTAGDPIALAPTLSRVIRSVAPKLRQTDVNGVEQVLDTALARERLAATLATLFGFLAVTLAAVGLYGVVAYNIGLRTQEMGVRMALGARSVDVLWLVIRQTLITTAAGVALGVPLAVAAARGVGAQLYGIGGSDPRALAGAALVLVAVGVAASATPARRAARIDPVDALRAD